MIYLPSTVGKYEEKVVVNTRSCGGFLLSGDFGSEHKGAQQRARAEDGTAGRGFTNEASRGLRRKLRRNHVNRGEDEGS